MRKRLARRGISDAGLALAVLSPALLNATVRPALAKSCLDAAFGSHVAAGAPALIVTSTTTFKGIAMKAPKASLPPIRQCATEIARRKGFPVSRIPPKLNEHE